VKDTETSIGSGKNKNRLLHIVGKRFVNDRANLFNHLNIFAFTVNPPKNPYKKLKLPSIGFLKTQFRKNTETNM